MTPPELAIEETAPTLSPALTELVEAFEAEVAEHPDSGFSAWVARARTGERAQRLTFPTGLLTETASAELGVPPRPLAWLRTLSRPEAYRTLAPNIIRLRESWLKLRILLTSGSVKFPYRERPAGGRATFDVIRRATK